MGAIIAVIIVLAVAGTFAGPIGILAVFAFVGIVAFMPKTAGQKKKEAEAQLEADVERMKAENVILENERLHAERAMIRATMPADRRTANDERLVLMRGNSRVARPAAKTGFGKRKAPV